MINVIYLRHPLTMVLVTTDIPPSTQNITSYFSARFGLKFSVLALVLALLWPNMTHGHKQTLFGTLPSKMHRANLHFAWNILRFF